MKYSGLSDEEVKKSRELEGSNVIPDSEPTTFWDEFKETFGDPMIRILLVIVVILIVMFFLGHAEIYEPIGTIVAILIVAFVTAKTAVASDTKYRELKDSTKKDTCKVYRNGIISVIEVDEVVVGDKVILQSGDKIPADGILVDGDLRVDNSVLNGEAEECKKTATAIETAFPEDLTGETFVDSYSLFRGAVVFDGEGVLDVRYNRERNCCCLVLRLRLLCPLNQSSRNRERDCCGNSGSCYRAGRDYNAEGSGNNSSS